jgi:hypothetical protein
VTHIEILYINIGQENAILSDGLMNCIELLNTSTSYEKNSLKNQLTAFETDDG